MIMLQKLFRTRHRERLGEPLYELAVRQARAPGFYTSLGVADRIDARFELYTLHVLLLVMRLRDEPEPGAERGAESAQALFDTYVSALDHTLRELGVGDISVGKKMRKLGESLYGRMTAYEGALRSADADALSASLARNVFEAEDSAVGAPLSAYALESRDRLAKQAFAAVLERPDWAEVAQ